MAKNYKDYRREVVEEQIAKDELKSDIRLIAEDTMDLAVRCAGAYLISLATIKLVYRISDKIASKRAAKKAEARAEVIGNVKAETADFEEITF